MKCNRVAKTQKKSPPITNPTFTAGIRGSGIIKASNPHEIKNGRSRGHTTGQSQVDYTLPVRTGLLLPRVVLPLATFPLVCPFPLVAGLRAWSTWFPNAVPLVYDPAAWADGSWSWFVVELVLPMFWGPRTPPEVTECSLRVTLGALGMSEDAEADPSLKIGECQVSPFMPSSLYSVALEEIPPGNLMLGKMESCWVMATLTFLSATTASAFCFPCKICFCRALT